MSAPDEFAGRLSERIRIEQPVSVRDSMGLQQPGWEPVCTCRAAIALEGSGQLSEGQALSAMGLYRVTIRRRSEVTVGQRIGWGNRLLLVRQLLDDPRSKDRLTLRCEELRG